jgi:hypothetical protein
MNKVELHGIAAPAVARAASGAPRAVTACGARA